MINNSERYMEVVSLAITSSGLFNALIVPNVGLAVPIAKCDYTYGWDFTEDEELSPSDGQTFRAQNQYWKATPAPVVKKNGTIVTAGFTIDYTEGTVIFSTQLAAADVVRCAYHYSLPSDISWGTGHIVAYLHGQAELHARGMAHLSRLRVAEVEMTRFAPQPQNSLIANLDSLVPEAAMYLTSYRNDSISVR
jgi:hypothetical protein